jgi:hypothetical protein
VTIRLEVVNISILAWLAWLGAECKGKTLLVIEIFFTLHRYCTVTVQYWCSVSKAKHDQVFSAALLNGRKIQNSLQLSDCDLTWRVASTTHWTLPLHWLLGTIHLRRQHSACLRGGGVSPCADGQKVTVHKDQKSPS